MSAKIRTVKRVTCVLGILFIMLGLLPVGVLSQVGSAFAQEGVTEEPTPTETEEPAAPPTEEPVAPPTEEPKFEVEFTPEVTLETTEPTEEPVLEMEILGAAAPEGPHPPGTDPTTLGLPSGGNLQSKCGKTGYPPCTKVDNVQEIDPVNQVGVGKTYSYSGNVVVLKTGTTNYYFTQGSGIECGNTYCVTWNQDGTITIVRKSKSSSVQDISNIQFWNTTVQDCEGSWGSCVGNCGETGTQTYTITKQASPGGKSCVAANGATRSCQMPACPGDCVGSWGECEGECGIKNGTQTYTITDPGDGGMACEANNGDTRTCDTDPCPEDCVGDWGECGGPCGTDQGIQTFTIISFGTPGGATCVAADGAERFCDTDPCPVDCVGEWGECEGPCGTIGKQKFTITTFADPDGQACEFDNEETRDCQTDACPTDTTGGGGGGGGGTTATGGGVAAVIPVTAAGGPTEELLVIPVTGVDLGVDFLALKQAFLFGGMLLFGASLLLEGASRKFRI